MTTTTAKKAFVLVQGSFSPPSFWDKVVAEFAAAGHEAYLTALLSAGERAQGPATMYEDAAAIHDIVARLADKEKDVVLVMNSYGGIPGSEASKGLSKLERQQHGKSGGFIGLDYVASFIAPVGRSINMMMSDDDFQPPTSPGDHMALNHDEDWKNIFSDLGEEDAKAYMAQMSKHPTTSFTGEITRPGYKDVPVTFILTEGNKIIPPEKQRAMIAWAEGEGITIDTVTIAAGHVPMLSEPEKVAEVLRRAVSHA